METKVFEAIKNDNYKLFNQIVSENKGVLNFSFGRFPLLSLCYLFKAKKIVKGYFKQLNSISTFNIVYEPIEANILFKKRAKKALRFFINYDKIVAPIEMLSAIDEREYLKQNYHKLKKNEQNKQIISKIYTLQRGAVCLPQNDKITLSNAPMTLKRKLIVLLTACLALIFAILPLNLYFFVNSAVGNGSENNPYNIYSISHFNDFLSNSHTQKNTQDFKYYKLKNNITISSPAQYDFYDILDGNGYTIKINPSTINIDKSTSFLTKNNYGTIKNVRLEFVGQLNRTQTNNDDVMLAFFSHFNYGTIENCNLKINTEFNSNHTKFSALSGFTTYNSGTIINSTIENNSILNANNSMIGGFCAINTTLGVIENSINHANIKALANTAESYNIGGISGENHGKIEKCKFTGNIELNSTTQNGVAVGGIVGYNNGSVNLSGVNGKITSNTENFALIGGIAGYNVLSTNGFFAYFGSITNCFSTMQFTTNFVEYHGAIIGYWVFYSYLQHSDNYFVLDDNFGIGVVYYEGTEFLVDEKVEGFNNVTLNQLLELDIYW